MKVALDFTLQYPQFENLDYMYRYNTALYTSVRNNEITCHGITAIDHKNRLYKSLGM